ncbi:MAG: hypothetical protein ACRDQ5_20680 [Sciscionella sp.]
MNGEAATQVTTGYVRARVHLPADAMWPNVSEAVAATLPGGWETSALAGADSDRLPSITIDQVDVPVVTHDGQNYQLALPSDHLLSLRLAYLTYTLLERHRQLAGMNTVHAAGAAVPSGGAVLILGDKGSGKTNTLFALAKLGYRPAGDDLVVLRLSGGGVDLFPGNRSAAVRGPAMPDTLYYEAKQHVRLDHQHSFLAAPVPVTHVVRISVHAAAPGVILTKAARLSLGERLRLHENLGRYVSGLPTPLTVDDTGCYGPVLCIDNPACAQMRRDLIEQLGHISFYYLQARSAAEAAQLIAKEVG